MDVHAVLDDLVDEQRALDGVVADLAPDQWMLPTPSPRWSITDQIGHLTFFDTTAALAITDAGGFAEHRRDLVASFADERMLDDATLGSFRLLAPAERLAEWRRRRDELHAAGRTLSDDTRVEWYGPSMGAKSFLTARLMEVWAHGQDVCDAVGARRPPSDRLRHIAQLGVITRGWSYTVRGATPPDGEVRVELTAPSGDVWTWGADDAPAAVIGPAEDFCLVGTQRRHVDDTALTLEGFAARDWMLVAQAFAGAPTQGPSAHQAAGRHR
ncbi:MAG: TIGR03084 family metal-binding protein [Ilumatobacteraceae bacterium]